MNADFDPISSLISAIEQSPNNVPLRQSLAELFLSRGQLEEAETTFRKALALDTGNQEVKLGLARCYLQQSKDSHALVIVEAMIKQSNAPAMAHLLYSRLMWRTGDVGRAVANYKAAIEEEPDLADEEYAERLGITAEVDYESESEIVDGQMRAGWNPPEDSPEIEIERPDSAFKDVGGMETVKEEIRLKIIYPLEHAEMYAAYGKKVGGGILMYGPPGCGKTHLARATAGEIKANFLNIGISDVLDMWIGNSERNLHDLFESARRNKPCVLFFDEVDALGSRRSDMQKSGGRHLINQFLSELDGVESNNDGLLVLAATNAPWHMDPAFRRPGRFDRILFIPPPDKEARAEILRLECRKKPVADLDYDYLAKLSEGYSGADIKAVVDLAVESKLQEAMKAGELKPLATKDLKAAIKKHRPTIKEWFSTAKNHAMYANEGGIYDDILKHFKM